MRILTIARRIIRQIVKDRRTLALMFVAPVLVIFLLYSVLNIETGKPKVLAVGLPADLQSQISKEAHVTSSSNLTDSMEKLKNCQTDAVITYHNSTVSIHVEGTQNSVTTSVKKAVSAAVASYSKITAEKAACQQMREFEQNFQQQLQNRTGNFSKKQATDFTSSSVVAPTINFKLPSTDIQYHFLNGSDDMTVFDNIAPLLMGFFIFFFVFLIAGVAFLRERISGTLERLLATPIRRHEIVFGYFLGFGAFVFLQTLVIQMFMIYGLHIALKGDFLLVTLINLLLAAGSLALGTLLSAFARNELQLFQFIPIVIVPQILFCGMFTLRGAPIWVTVLSKVFPLTYAADALTNVAIRGFGFDTIVLDLAILFAYMVLFLICNTLVLKKFRKI